jgi:putative phage-type endonuclease
MNAPAQGTPEWLALRAGHCTASRFKDVLARIKSGEAASRRNYRIQLVTERLTGRPCESYTNAAMEWGTCTEPQAREAYEALTGSLVEQTSFLVHPAIKWVGASPDGCVDDEGAIEIKCPYQSTVHVETLERGMPAEHMAQCQGVLWVSGRKWIDFVSFDPRMPEHLQLYRQRIERDPAYIENLHAEVANFLCEVDVLEAKLLARAPIVQATNPDTVALQP